MTMLGCTVLRETRKERAKGGGRKRSWKKESASSSADGTQWKGRWAVNPRTIKLGLERMEELKNGREKRKENQDG